MDNELTSKNFWKNYWESKSGLVFEVPENHTFHQVLSKIIGQNNTKTAIELGGFPGYYAVFLKKYFNLQATLLDYYIHKEIMESLLHKNNLQKPDIAAIEADLFNYKPEEKYDLVLSCGLIEHFNDTRDIINRHVSFLDTNGVLLITLPNFRGINGWVQKTFDHDNYVKHNINSMDVDLLKNIAKELHLKDVDVYYFGGFSTWLENRHQKSAIVKLFVKTIWFAGKILSKIFPVESKLMSPYIVLTAKR